MRVTQPHKVLFILDLVGSDTDEIQIDLLRLATNSIDYLPTQSNQI